MSKNEAQTRQEIIDLRLKKAGWDVSNRTQIEEAKYKVLRTFQDLKVILPDIQQQPNNFYKEIYA